VPVDDAVVAVTDWVRRRVNPSPSAQPSDDGLADGTAALFATG
jgi:hypothetical protein